LSASITGSAPSIYQYINTPPGQGQNYVYFYNNVAISPLPDSSVGSYDPTALPLYAEVVPWGSGVATGCAAGVSLGATSAYPTSASLLASLAFRYWANDLQSGQAPLGIGGPVFGADIANQVQPVGNGGSLTFGSYAYSPAWNPQNDPATWQHMQTFVIGNGQTLWGYSGVSIFVLNTNGSNNTSGWLTPTNPKGYITDSSGGKWYYCSDLGTPQLLSPIPGCVSSGFGNQYGTVLNVPSFTPLEDMSMSNNPAYYDGAGNFDMYSTADGSFLSNFASGAQPWPQYPGATYDQIHVTYNGRGQYYNGLVLDTTDPSTGAPITTTNVVSAAQSLTGTATGNPTMAMTPVTGVTLPSVVQNDAKTETATENALTSILNTAVAQSTVTNGGTNAITSGATFSSYLSTGSMGFVASYGYDPSKTAPAGTPLTGASAAP
jgi:hypothetical protein